MSAERLLEIFALMAYYESENPESESLCSVARQITELDGAGISITTKAGAQEPLCASNGIAQRLMELEIAFNEGPGREAIQTGTFNEVTDLTSERGKRWMFYSSEAIKLGVQAVFGFPIQIGAVVFGALSLYCERAGSLSEKQSSSAYLMASVIGRSVLEMQAGVPRDAISDELQGESSFDFTVHQASGMLSMQAQVSVKDALILLRAHAFSMDLSLSVLAHRIIDRSTWFDSQSGYWMAVGSENEKVVE
ncbi:MAG: ANTAR domain-containing protein [Acidimicrobiales bacterium]